MKKMALIAGAFFSVAGMMYEDANGQIFRRWNSGGTSTCVNCQPTHVHNHVVVKTVKVHHPVVVHKPVVKVHGPVHSHKANAEVNYGYQFVGSCEIRNAVDLFMQGRGQGIHVVPNDAIYIKLKGKYDTLKLVEGDKATVVLNLQPVLPADYLKAFLDDHTTRSIKYHLIKVQATVGKLGEIRIPKSEFVPVLAQRLSRLGLLQNESFIGLDEFEIDVKAVVKVDDWLFRSCNQFTLVGAIDPLGTVNRAALSHSATGAGTGESKAAGEELPKGTKKEGEEADGETTSTEKWGGMLTSVRSNYSWLR